MDGQIGDDRILMSQTLMERKPEKQGRFISCFQILFSPLMRTVPRHVRKPTPSEDCIRQGARSRRLLLP